MLHLPGSPEWQRVGSHSTVLDYHLSMLHDTARMDSFRRAINATVKPGDVVVDIGSGSGILSFMACEAGASKVYAIEGGPVIEVARQLAVDNGFDDRIEFLSGWSIDVGLPELADVLISETLGNAAFDEGIAAWTYDARQRLLKPGAALIPERVRLWVAAVEAHVDYAVVDDWLHPALPYDYSFAHHHASKTLWMVDFTPSNLLGQPELAADVDLHVSTNEAIIGSGVVQIERDGVLHGLGCWFDSLLCRGVTVDNLPPRTDSSWSHGFLPLAEPLEVYAGHQFAWELSVAADGEAWTWHLEYVEPQSTEDVALDGAESSGS